jgi:transcriptional regulator GlxA family with amidase domain
MVTASGVSAGTDMALAVVARLFGRGVAVQIATLTEYEWQSDPTRDSFAKYLNQGKLAPDIETHSSTQPQATESA